MGDFWENKRKKKRSKFVIDEDDFFGDFDDISKLMNDMMKRAFQGSFSNKSFKINKPIVYGYSMKVGPDGKPKIEEFGNIETKQKKIREEREPLIDVIDKHKEVTVIAELPGVEKKEINVTVEDKGEKLVLDVPNKFYKEVELPSKVKDSAKAQYKNGVLEVNLTKIKPSRPKKKKIKIE